MTDTKHPITPPPNLIEEWISKSDIPGKDMCEGIATRAAQWGADQQLKLDAEQIAQSYQKGADMELEACCEWLKNNTDYHVTIEFLRAARRPKPQSLKEQALNGLDALDDRLKEAGLPADLTVLRRALEQLSDD
jgi:hypothetical protein